MKRTLLIFSFFMLNLNLFQVNAQGVAINPTGSAADSSAALDISYNNKGLLVPRLTDSERNAISNPAEGLLIFNTTTKCFNVFRNSIWFEICGNCISPPSPSVTSNSPVCSGGTITLNTASIPGATYAWTGPNGFSSSQQNPVISNAQTSASGTYYLTLSMNGCTSAPVAHTVAVNQTPSSSFTYSPTGIGVNANVTFTPSVSGAAYSWTFQGGNPSTSTAQFPVVQWSSTGTYNVSLTVTQNGCSSTYNTTISVVSAVTLNTYNFTGHEYLLDCDHYGCAGASSQVNANCFCQANGYSSAISFTTGYIYTVDCFGYEPNCYLHSSWCSGGTQRYVIVTVTCQ